MTSSTKSRPFSPSSERYIVNQIQSSFAGSAYNCPSIPTGSAEMESGQLLESVAETDTIACLDGDGEEDIHMPTEDDIEKSFRVNQDGSMTVEMRVRLTIKEEETVHWTTTLSRSSVASQMKTVSELHSDLGAPLSDNIQSDVDPLDSEVIQDCSEEHAFHKERDREMEPGKQITMVTETQQPLPSTPEWCKVHQKQSVGSTVKVTETEIQENVLGSYAYKEETSNGEIKQEHCMIRQCRSRPVPKPRSNLPSELNSTTSQLQSNSYKSAEILQLQDKGEVHETVLHIYEQQTCQENFFANTQLCMQGMNTYSSPGARPASSDAAFPASSEKTAYSSSADVASSTNGSLKRQENLFQSDPQALSKKDVTQEVRIRKSRISSSVTEFPKPSEPKTISTADTSKRRKPVRVIVKKNHIFQIAAPEQKRKDNKTDTLKEVKKIRADTFSRPGTMRRAEHYRSKAVHRPLKRRNDPANRQGSVPSMLRSPVQLTVQSLNESSTDKEQYDKETDPFQAAMFNRKRNESSSSPKKDLLYASANKCTLIRQTSMHEERDFQRETRELSESISLPALHSSSSVFKEYVELWLQKSEHDQTQVLSTEELQENTTFLTSQEAQPSSDVSDITREPRESRETSKDDIPYCVSVDNNSSPNNLSSTKSTVEEKLLSTKETSPSNSSPERISSQANTSKKDTLISKHATETKSLPSNSLEKTPLPRNKISSEDSFLLNEDLSGKIIQNVLQENTSLARNVSVKSTHATSDNNSACSESSQEFLKLTSNQEIMPRTMKTFSQKCSRPETKTLEKTSSGNGHMKQTPIPRNTSSEKTLLQNQPSVEKIPKNNTLTKASIFNNQNAEKTLLFTNVSSDKKSELRQSSLTKLSESKRVSQAKSQISSDVTSTRNLQQSGDITTSETNKCTESQVQSPTEMTVLQAEKLYTVKMAVRPDMRHVLEELCHSIQSLREVRHHKQRSCLEKSNSMPDFSSHLASTFGSSSRVLLAFLSVMTLKDGLANLNARCQVQNLSCSEALLVLQSLKEMAVIEDAEQLRASLNALQNSISVQLLQSWKGFQELSNTIRSHSVTPDSSRSGSFSESCSEEEVIQGLMEDLGVPDKVREELAALCTQEEENMRGNQADGLENLNESLPEEKMNGFTESFPTEKTVIFPDSVIEENANVYVKSVIEKAVKAHLEDCGISDVSMTYLLSTVEKEIGKVVTNKNEREFYKIKRTMQADCSLDFEIKEDVSPSESVIEAIEDGTVGEDCNAKAKCIMDENLTYSGVLHTDEGTEATKKKMDDRDIDERITKKHSKSLESPSISEGKQTSSEEEKSSIEEDDSCDEELMSFSEDRVSDKEENIQTTPTAVSSIDQKHTMTAFLYSWQSEDQVSPTLRSDSKTDKETGQPKIQAAIHVEPHMKEDMTHHDTKQPQISYEQRMIPSEEEQVVLGAPECYTIYQEHFGENNEYGPGEAIEHEEKSDCFNGKKKNSVAELINTMESVAAVDSNKPKVNRILAHTEVQDISDIDDLTEVSHISSEQDRIEEFIKGLSEVQTQIKGESKKHIQLVSPKELPKMMKTTKQTHMDLTSEPISSSLAFSYDSRSSSLAQEPEGTVQVNRVKSIREMFLAKSNATTQNQQQPVHSTHSDTSDYQAESSDSGANQSQTTPETSSGEDESSRLSIAKGFVRRTIERLYGRGNPNSTGPDEKRPLSASKGRKREAPGRTNVTSLASFHEGQTRIKTNLSYYNATSSFDVNNEPPHCVTLNAQVGPGDAVLIDKGRWLLRENQLICQSSPEQQESQSNTENDVSKLVDPKQDTVNEDFPYSLFCPASPHSTLPSSELEEPACSSGSKFIYFKLPNASDSEMETEGRNADTPSKKEPKVTPVTQSIMSWAEKNTFLPAFNPPVVKKTDNKVHPSSEAITPPVVTQPTRGQSAQTEVARRSTEPDVLEMLFLFCGQHCPLL